MTYNYTYGTSLKIGNTYQFSFSFSSYPAVVSLDYGSQSVLKNVTIESKYYTYTGFIPTASDQPIEVTSDQPGSIHIAIQLADPAVPEVTKPVTLAFSPVDDVWPDIYSFAPSYYGRVEDTLFSLRNDGSLHQHEAGTKYNRFYGTDYKCGITFVVNEFNDLVKILKFISVQASQKPNKVHIRTEHPHEQGTTIVYNDEVDEFEDVEGVYYADVMGDMLSPNVQGDYYEKMLNGDLMKGQYFLVYVEFDENDKQIRFDRLTAGFIPSSGHKA